MQNDGGPIKNCCSLGYNNNYKGVYTISNFCGVKYSNAEVYCDTQSGGGGWTVIHRRQDETINFTDRDWVEYEDGFGLYSGEFWMGDWELRIDYQLKNGTMHYNKSVVMCNR